MQVESRLTFDKVRFDQDNTAHLVVSLKAPSVNIAEKRPRICIIPVLDVSPSMEGEKIKYAKRSLLKLIDHLGADDYCGLVKFSSTPELVAKPQKVTSAFKDKLKSQVGDLTLSGGTNIGDALLMGLSVANQMDLSSDVITRVILFTDGDANTGLAKTPKDILALVSPNLGIASVSAFGYGEDVKQDLLGNLAKSGNGNYAYVKNPDDALAAFGKELGGLLSTYATNLELEVVPLAGHEIEQVLSQVDADEKDVGQVTVKIPDLLADEVRDVVFTVKLKQQKNAFPREVNVFDIRVGYDVLDANSRRERKTFEGKAKVQFVKEDEAQAKVHAELDHIVGLAQIVRAQLEAEDHAKRGDYQSAQGVMRSMTASFGGRGLADLGAVACNVGSRMGNAAVYSSSSSYLASMTRGATRGMGVSSYDADAARDLLAAGVNMSNVIQEQVADSFTVGGDDINVTSSGVAAGPIMGGITADGNLSWQSAGLSPNITGGFSGVNTVGSSGSNLPFLISAAGQVLEPQVSPEPQGSKPKKAGKKTRGKIKQKSKLW